MLELVNIRIYEYPSGVKVLDTSLILDINKIDEAHLNLFEYLFYGSIVKEFALPDDKYRFQMFVEIDKEKHPWSITSYAYDIQYKDDIIEDYKSEYQSQF